MSETTYLVHKPKGVKVISVLYFIGAIYFLGAALIWVILGATTIALVYEGFLGTIKHIWFYSALGILCLSLAIDLWRYRNWARLMTISFVVAVMVLAIIFILIDKLDIPTNIFFLTISGIVGSYLGFGPKVKDAFK